MGFKTQPLIFTTVANLRDALLDARLEPTDKLTKNRVGNLSVYREDEQIGFIDLHEASVEFFGDA